MSTPSRRGGILAAALISVLVVAVLAITVLVFTGIYFSRSVHVEKRREGGRESVRIETPVGAVRVQKSTRDFPKLQIPVYPGAVEASDTGKTTEIELDFGRKHTELSVAAAKYTTSDPADKVLGYYRKELPNWILSRHRRGAFHLEFNEGGHKRLVAIHERAGKTEIALASVGEPAEN